MLSVKLAHGFSIPTPKCYCNFPYFFSLGLTLPASAVIRRRNIKNLNEIPGISHLDGMLRAGLRLTDGISMFTTILDSCGFV